MPVGSSFGEVIENQGLGRKRENEITVADLTGAAVQDFAIAELALAGLERRAH
ncbi:MAG: hypothetical protein WCA38_16330 [Candidatus Acidiferrales bacterium]